jgi:iron(III) transport system substrate-binding protein
VIEAARAEGVLNLVWSESSVGGSEGARRLVEGMNKLHGLDVKLQFTPGPPMAEIGAKIVQEHQAGRPATSDIFLGSDQYQAALIEAGALEAVDWTSWAPNIRDSRLLAPGSMAVEIDTRVPGIAYNSDRLQGNAVPTSLEDVLKPQYKGCVASTPYAASFDQLASPELWGEDRTIAYVTKLADQIAGLIRCGELERLLSGEFDMMVLACGHYDALRVKARGAPIGYVVPADAALKYHMYMAVPQNAAHPNAAKLFIDYLLSRAGQDIYYEFEFVDHDLVPGSKTAQDLQTLQPRGSQFSDIDVALIQRSQVPEMNRVRRELQRLLQSKQ